MERRIYSVLLVMLLLSVTASLLGVHAGRSSQTWTVDDNGPADFGTIQGAINSSLVVDGDTVYVHNGVYREHVLLNKSILLMGQDPLATIIDGNASMELRPPLAIFNTEGAVVMNFTVRNTTSFMETYGISIYSARNTTIRNVVAEKAYYGIKVENSTHCMILDNVIRDSYNSGIVLRHNSSYNMIAGNRVADNPTGIMIEQYCLYNVLYRNNIVNNSIQQFKLFPPTYTSWDNGKEGNYWSDYLGEDIDGDGLGDTDTPHLGVDAHPLAAPWSQTRTYQIGAYQVVVTCNYTVASFAFNDTTDQTSFLITGPAGWSGFCEVTIPKALASLNTPFEMWIVTMGASAITPAYESVDNSTLLSFNYILGPTMQANRLLISIQVNLNATSLDLQAPEHATQNHEVTLSATLLDSENNPISNAAVEFHFREGSNWELLGSSQTNQSGTASFSHTPAHAGTFTLRAVFAGDGIHTGSTSVERSLTVASPEADYGPYILLAAGLGLLVVVALIVFARKREKSG